MSTGLATRCPACSTVFRVVPDQLRVSAGWVRCGRCAEVFDASESLLDMETGAPRLWATVNRPAEAAAAAAAPAASASATPAPAVAPAGRAASAEAVDAAPLGPAVPAPGIAEAPAAEPPTDVTADVSAEVTAARAALASAPIPELALAAAAEPVAATAAPAAAAPSTATPADLPSLADEPPPEAPAPTDAAGDPRADPADMPAFVRRADRAERWRRPGVRAALAAAALAGVAGLAAQITWAYRDLAAARYPGLRPVLEQGCAWLGCRIEAARAIDALAVESSGLLRVERSSLYRLSVALRNNAGIDVMLPALDLALTDTRGRLVARKVLHAAELGAPVSTLGAGRDITLQATLQATLPDAEPVAGYTVELFYP